MQFVVSSEVFGPNRNDETKAITTQESEGRLFVEGQHDGLYKPLVAKASYHCWLLSPVKKIGGAVDEGELTTHAITYESAENEKQPRKRCQSWQIVFTLPFSNGVFRPTVHSCGSPAWTEGPSFSVGNAKISIHHNCQTATAKNSQFKLETGPMPASSTSRCSAARRAATGWTA